MCEGNPRMARLGHIASIYKHARRHLYLAPRQHRHAHTHSAASADLCPPSDQNKPRPARSPLLSPRALAAGYAAKGTRLAGRLSLEIRSTEGENIDT